ncbi:MAG: hypothetical protein R6V39_01450, partial [Desulfovibrionales bacterium]
TQNSNRKKPSAYPRFCLNALKTSHNTIPALTEMFSECFVPACGISTQISDMPTISSPTPYTS